MSTDGASPFLGGAYAPIVRKFCWNTSSLSSSSGGSQIAQRVRMLRSFPSFSRISFVGPRLLAQQRARKWEAEGMHGVTAPQTVKAACDAYIDDAMVKAGESNCVGLLKTRKLLKIRGAQLAKNAQKAVRLYTTCTRNSGIRKSRFIFSAEFQMQQRSNVVLLLRDRLTGEGMKGFERTRQG
jgi:hypothetical protein